MPAAACALSYEWGGLISFLIVIAGGLGDRGPRVGYFFAVMLLGLGVFFIPTRRLSLWAAPLHVSLALLLGGCGLRLVLSSPCQPCGVRYGVLAAGLVSGLGLL